MEVMGDGPVCYLKGAITYGNAIKKGPPTWRDKKRGWPGDGARAFISVKAKK